MSLFRPVPASLLGAIGSLCVLMPGAGFAQTATAGPTAPASRALVGIPRPMSRTAPSTGPRRMRSDTTLPDAKMKAPPRLTAAERAEQKKLEHDLKICIGC